MSSEIRSRLLILVGLAIIGIALAGVGTALGVTDPIANTGSNTEFVVSEENVTFSNGGETETVVGNMSYVREITIEETAPGQFTVDTEKEQPLMDSERERAKKIVLDNETVQQEIDSMDEYELIVEPVQKLNLSSHSRYQYNLTVTEVNGTGDEFTVDVENTTSKNQDGSVTIKRAPSYMEDRAVVKVRQPDVDKPNDLKYTIGVDLVGESVTNLTDRNEIREDSSINVTQELNTTTIDQP